MKEEKVKTKSRKSARKPKSEAKPEAKTKVEDGSKKGAKKGKVAPKAAAAPKKSKKEPAGAAAKKKAKASRKEMAPRMAQFEAEIASGEAPAPRVDPAQVEVAAYFKFRRRVSYGHVPDPVADWFEAEAELIALQNLD